MKKKKKMFTTFTVSTEHATKFWIPSNGNINHMDHIESNSWFDILQSDCTDNILEKDVIMTDDHIIRSQKICIHPTPEQKDFLLKWCDIYRYVYNQTIHYIRKNPDVKINFISLRAIMKIQLKDNISMWKIIQDSKIPIHTLDNAIHDVCKAYKTAFSNKNNGNISHFLLKYKKMTNLKQTITIEGSAFSKTKNTFCTKVLGNNIQSDESIESNKDSRLTYNKGLDQFYLYIPKEKNIKEIRERDKWCSIDPGVRTFLTGYSNHHIFKICNNVKEKIESKLNKLDKIDKYLGRKKTYFKTQYKIKNIIDDLHWKTANYLCSNYDHIILGKLSTRDVVDNENSKLSKKNKRLLYTLAHYRFRERLAAKCEEYNVKYHLVDESYTTKTCGCCGDINNKIRSEKLFICEKCGVKIDRDYNGARNIIIKNENILN